MKKKSKISLIIDKNFYSKELNIEIISKILSLQNVTIVSFLVVDQKITIPKKDFFITRILKKIIFYLEKRFLFTQNKILNKKLYKRINSIKEHNLNIVKNNDKSPIFFIDKDQSEKIKNQKINILVNLTDIIILSKISDIAFEGIIGSMKEKYDTSTLLPGFETSYKNIKFSNIYIYLVKNNSKIIKIIDKGYYNSKKYWLFNLAFLKEKSNIIIFKNLKFILSNNKTKILKKINVNAVNYQYLSFVNLFSYVLDRYIFHLFKKKKLENWSIKLSINKFNFNFSRYSNFMPPKGSFWADPFLFAYKKKKIMFFLKILIMKKKKVKFHILTWINLKKLLM